MGICGGSVSGPGSGSRSRRGARRGGGSVMMPSRCMLSMVRRAIMSLNLPSDPTQPMARQKARASAARVCCGELSIRERCRQEGLEWADTSDKGSVKSACVDRKAMLIVSWRIVLERLLYAASTSGHDTVKNDILQLQGLTGRMDSAAFLPLRADEVTNQETARRLINYVELIDDIINELVHAGAADTEGLRVSNTYHYAGKFLNIHADGRFESWLGIDLRAWRDEGISPLWWRFRTNTGVARRHFERLPELYSDVRTRDDGLYVPIRLKTGVERVRVIGDTVAQMKRIADQVLKTVPNQNPALC